ncbi:hemerythrin domain-containing protein [Paenibacillus sp. GD4]|uniref:hemerythrin domain-containing protein n=1 Tax=Paenibacillus sp. GD4 TaxID=3068890 RepID=UPI002796AC28|nr:hemerythrin domain-containing protein [Paenibacillus sp. GD4]MDQ1909927.1 hemerythrin domain-containing protein [Paenibacillus sp. GD4]
MKTAVPWKEPLSEPAHPTELYHAIKQLIEEHEQLKLLIQALEEKARQAALSRDTEEQLKALRDLKADTVQFMSQMNRHSSWEEQVLYPFLHEYFDLSMGPSMVPSFWVLEKDHDLAEAYMDSFIDAVEDLASPGDRRQLQSVAEHLLQACRILSGHLAMEEQLVYPLSDQVLTDVDYFFS